MTNMFKKSLVAIALAGFSTGAMAATVDASAVNVANEWLSGTPAGPANAPNAVTGMAFDFVLGAAYTQNDLIRFTFTGDSLLAAGIPGTIAVAGGTDGGTATLGLISNELNSSGDRVVTYRVTTVDGDTTGGTGTVSGINFRAAAISGSINVSFSAETSTGQALDTAGGNARVGRLVTVASQFATLSHQPPGVDGDSGLDKVIDVSSSRTQFVAPQQAYEWFQPFASNMGNANTGYIAFNPDSDYSAFVSGIEYTLTGDFGWMLHPTTGALLPNRFVSTCDVPAATVTASSIVVECGYGVDLEFNAAGNTATIPTQTLGLEANVVYTVAGQTSPASKKLTTTAGQWTLNGSEVEVSYMPYSSNISQVINVTNRSNQSGDISAEAITEDGTTYDLGVVGYSEAGSITRVAGGILTALSEKVGTDLSAAGQTQRFALRIVTNAPEDKVEVYSAYNVGQSGARLVVNDSNGGGLSK